MQKIQSNIQKWQIRSSLLTTTISLTLALFVVGLFGIIVMNTHKISEFVQENIGFTIVFNDSVNKNEVMKFQSELNQKNFVRETKYIDKDIAAKELQDELGENFVSIFGYNVLNESLDVRVSPEFSDLESIKQITRELEKQAGIKEIVYQEYLIDVVNKNIQKIGTILFVIFLLLLTISIVLINNTVRLTFQSKRFLIRTMQLIGATPAYIRRPYLFQSFVNGLVGSIFAVWGLFMFIQFIESEFESIIDFGSMGGMFLLVFFTGLCLSLISSYFAIRRLLRMNLDEMYSIN